MALEAGAAAILLTIVGWDRFFGGLQSPDLVWAALCFGGQVVAYAGYTLALRSITRSHSGPPVGFVHAAGIVAAGFSPVFTVSPAGGFEVDKQALLEMDVSPEEATARVLATNVLEYIVLAPAALAAALLVLAGIGGSAEPSLTLPWLLVVPGLAAAVWATSPGPSGRLRSARGSGWLRRGLAHAVAGATLARRVLVAFPSSARVLVGFSLYWIGDIVTLWAALRMFGVQLPPPALVLAFATGYALTRRGLPAGGPGAVEILLALALSWLGGELSACILGVFVYRLFNFWLPLIPTFLLLARTPRALKELPRAEGRALAPRART
jgi:uncharacterized membrane protein YbhN (UPF0104 family)